MSQNIQIKGKVYNNIESIKAEDADNLGTYVSFVDTTIASGGATNSDILLGKKIYCNNTLITGTNDNPLTSDLYTECNQEKYGSILTATVTGLGNEDPSTVIFTVDNDFTPQGIGIKEVTFNGDTFVKFPIMYRKINTVVDNQITSFTMSNVKVDNTYEPYSCFVAPDNSILPYVLIGKYCYSSTSAASSTTSDTAVLTIDNARALAQARGTGYQQYDWQIQKLFVDLCLLISQTVNFNSGQGVQNYLGVYNLVNYIWVDGWTGTGSQWVIATNPANYINEPTSSSTGYTALSYAQPTASNEIMKLGYDSGNAFANFPSATTSNGSYDTYYCDYYYSYESGSHPIVSLVGHTSANVGLWYCPVYLAWTRTNCARLCYRPINI